MIQVNLPNINVKGLQRISKTPGTSQIKITARKQERIFTAITELFSLYLLNIPRDPYTINVKSVCIGQI